MFCAFCIHLVCPKCTQQATKCTQRHTQLLHHAHSAPVSQNMHTCNAYKMHANCCVPFVMNQHAYKGIHNACSTHHYKRHTMHAHVQCIPNEKERSSKVGMPDPNTLYSQVQGCMQHAPQIARPPQCSEPVRAGTLSRIAPGRSIPILFSSTFSIRSSSLTGKSRDSRNPPGMRPRTSCGTLPKPSQNFAEPCLRAAPDPRTDLS